MKRILITAAVLLAAAAAGSYYAFMRSEAVCNGCNIILISIDTLRADRLGCYGYQRPTTPNVDTFAKDAVRFSAAISQAPSTAPSHGSMLTGVLPSVHQALLSFKSKLSPEVRTLAEIVKDTGYRTASFNGGGQVSAEFGFGRGFDDYNSYAGADYGNERFADRVRDGIQWIERSPQKFFLFLHTFEVHLPYAPDPANAAMFAADYRGELTAQISEELIRSINRGRKEAGEADRKYISDLYDAEIRGMDTAMGGLIDFLKRTGRYSNTMIIFTSDHGEEFGERGRVAVHADTLFDELLKVPLIIKFPGQRYAGETIDTQVRSIDILPTVAAAAGLLPGKTVQGRSMLTLLEGKPEFDQYAVSQIDAPWENLPRSLRSNEWKYIRMEEHRRLFNLLEDPGETKNVAGEFPQVLEALRKELRQILNLAQRPAEKQSTTIDEKTMDQLRSLGYVK